MRSSFIASVVFAANLLMVPSSMAFQIRGAPKKGTRKGPVPHGEIFGYVRDERGFPVVRATVYFGSRGAVVRAYGAETDSKGRYRMEIVPGDWDIRADSAASGSGKYSQIAQVHVEERSKAALDLTVSSIEDYSTEKDGAGDPQDPCAPERVRKRSWIRASEVRRRMGMATTEADYALEIGGVFEYRAQDAERIAGQRGQQGLPPTKAPKSLPVLSTKDLALKEAESLFACAEKWMTISCAGGNREACSARLDRLRFSVSNFYWLTSSNYAYMPPQNYAVAMEWAHKGAQAGYVQSMKDLGQYYLDGRLVEKSSAEAFRWLKAAAEGGCKPAMTLVARMYEQGDGTQKDRLQAAFWATLGWGLMPSGLSRTELAEVQNLATAWTPSKDAKGKCIEPAAQASSGSLPKAEVIGSVPGNPQIIVDNATEYAITVSLAGPTTQTVIIPAGQSRTVTVAQGGYGVTATSSGPGVIPLSGNETYSAGLQYRVRYFLSPK